ncbi:MAG: hypothetical protein AABW56_02085 [Nanoarchaeota archaeon]
MIELEGEFKRWGNSAGLRVKIKDLVKNKFRFNEKVRVLVLPRNNVLKETFGTLKFKRPTEKLLRESDKELYND